MANIVPFDISRGTEPTPVLCADLEAAGRLPPLAPYVAGLVGLDGASLDEYKPADGCTCTGDCSANVHACSCLSSGAPYEFGRLRNAQYHGPIAECNERCCCHGNCGTRVVQHGVTVPLEVFWTGARGWGVRALAKIQRGSFVCEYTGEVVRTEEARRRYSLYDKSGDNYLISLREHLAHGILRTNIDATRMGNVGRYINHSCEPSLGIQIVRHRLMVPSAALFTNRDVDPGEELSFSYGPPGSEGPNKRPCLCGSPGCYGAMPYDPDL